MKARATPELAQDVAQWWSGLKGSLRVSMTPRGFVLSTILFGRHTWPIINAPTPFFMFSSFPGRHFTVIKGLH